MFLGQFYHNLDEKGRLIMPARYREPLQKNGAVLMRGFDQNLMVVSSEYFRIIYERVNKMSITDSGARLLRRLIFSGAVEIEFDKTGRILLPQYLREAYEIASDVYVVGAGGYIEIWASHFWEAQLDQLKDVNVISSRFEALDLSSG